jgi:hypothetical protein
MSKVTIQEAEFLTGLTRQAINYATKNGTLSYTQNERGVKVIDISELQRASYPLIKTMEELEDFRKFGKKATDVKARQNLRVKEESDVVSRVDLLEQQIENNQKMLESLERERNRERDLYEKQIDTLTESLKTAQDTAHKVTLLLEDKSKPQGGAGEWEKAFKALEERISNQDAQAKKEIEDIKKNSQQQVMRYKTALEAEKNKPFWKKILAS